MSWLRRFVFGDTNPLHTRLEKHFRPHQLGALAVHERKFPPRVQADLQCALDAVMRDATIRYFSGVLTTNYGMRPPGFTSLLTDDPRKCDATMTVPQYEEVDIGEAEPVRQLKDEPYLLLPSKFFRSSGIHASIANSN